MDDLTALPNKLDVKKGTCRAIVETPKGARNKFDYNPEANLFELAKLLPEGMMFPFDFGFIPSTRGGDGDPLDILVLMDAPAHPGCLIEVRLIGVIEGEQTEDGKAERNDRILGVATQTFTHEKVRTIKDVSRTLLSQLGDFFVNYNRQEGKKYRVTGTGGPSKAIQFVKSGMAARDQGES